MLNRRWGPSHLSIVVLIFISVSAFSATEKSFAWSNPLPLEYSEGQTAPRKEIRDPCIIREGDTYYLIFTMYPFRNREASLLNSPNQGGSPGIALYSSKDLKSWTFANWMIKAADLPDSSPYKNRFWAPEIHKFNNKFYLIFTADNWINGKYNNRGVWGAAGYSFIGVSDKVTGPYAHITYVDGGTCDMTLSCDRDGQVYAIKPKGDIYIQKIDLSKLDHDEVKFMGEEKRIVARNNDDIGLKANPEYLEGPWLEKIGATYCVFFAAIYRDKTHPELLGYRTNVAYATSMEGPWQKDARGECFFGGHLVVFDGPNGGKWFAYRWEKDNTCRGRLCIDPLELNPDGKIQAHCSAGENSITLP